MIGIFIPMTSAAARAALPKLDAAPAARGSTAVPAFASARVSVDAAQAHTVTGVTVAALVAYLQ